MLRINPKKTKMMIFQRCTRKCEHNFRIGNEVIDVVQNYTRITSSGDFLLSLEHLRQKALHALLSLRWHTDLNGLKVTRPSFFWGVPSYFEALWYPHLYFYGKSNT